jgi:hypothetical protein
MCLWSNCGSIPARPERAGYFRPIIDGNWIAGPIVSTHYLLDLLDRAVGQWYPLAALAEREARATPGLSVSIMAGLLLITGGEEPMAALVAQLQRLGIVGAVVVDVEEQVAGVLVANDAELGLA